MVLLSQSKRNSLKFFSSFYSPLLSPPTVLSKKTEKKIDNFYNLWYYNIVDRGAFLNQ